MITKKQKMLLDYVATFIAGNGYSPTYREIMRALGYKSVSTVAKHIDNLVASGHLMKIDGAVRSVELAGVVLGPDVDPLRQACAVLEREARRRDSAGDEVSVEEAKLLRRATAILQK